MDCPRRRRSKSGLKTRPASARRTARFAYLFGAICPARGVGSALAQDFVEVELHHVSVGVGQRWLLSSQGRVAWLNED
jgi:hypothetical protein